MTIPPVTDAAFDPRTHRADAAFRRYLHTGDPAAIADLFDLAAGDLHRTALHLCGDDATAHDLVQITFLVALERRGFDEGRPVLPWLAGILRNQAALVHRRRAQRLDRDRLRVEPSEDPTQRAAEHELAGEVEAALDQLPEMYRPVVRLHVLHGLDAGAIAVNLARPGGTVRTQLMRGLEKLRALLPIGVAGVVAGLLPSTGTAAVRTAVLAAAGSGRRASVVALSKAQARPPFGLLAVAGLMALAMSAWWWGGDEMSPPTSSPTVVQHEALPAAPIVPVADALALPATPREVAVAVPAAFELRGVVTGIVRGVEGQPIEGADVLLWPQERPTMHGATFTPPPTASVRTDKDGTFVLRANGTQCYLLARTADAICEHGVFGELEGRTRIDGLEFQLQPLVEQRGRLLDPEGQPVRDFAFGTYQGSSMSESMRLAISGFRRTELPHLTARTDDAGAFATVAPANVRYRWQAQHPRFPMLSVVHRASEGPLALQFARGAALGGVVRLANGAPAAGAKVTVADWPRREAVCDATGAWSVEGVSLRDGLWLSVEHAQAALHCALVGAASTTRETRLEAPRAIAGRFVDAHGQPLPDRELRFVGDRELDTGMTYEQPSTWEFLLKRNCVRTAADGSFRLDGLYDGSFRIEWTTPLGEYVPLLPARSGNEDLLLTAPDRMATLVGKVLDGMTGAPIEAGTLGVLRNHEGTSWIGRNGAFAAPGGELRFGDLVPGLVRLKFQAPGYAELELPARTLQPGEQRCIVKLFPLRQLLVEVRTNGVPTDGAIRVRTADGQDVMLWAGGPSYDKLNLTDGRVRLDRLPAQPLQVTLVRGGDEDVILPVDLTQPRAEPLVFELEVVAAAPVLRFALLVRTCAPGTDTSRWSGRLDQALLLALEQERDHGLGLPEHKVTLTFRNDAGKVLATGTITPKGSGRFGLWTKYADGKGGGSTSPMPAIDVELRTHAVTVTVECEGRQPVTRRFLPHEVLGENVGFALVLPAQ